MSQRSLLEDSPAPVSQRDNDVDGDGLRMPSPTPYSSRQPTPAERTSAERAVTPDDDVQCEFKQGSQQHFKNESQPSQEHFGHEPQERASQGSQHVSIKVSSHQSEQGPKEPFDHEPQQRSSQGSQQKQSQGSQNERSSSTLTSGNPLSLQLPLLQSSTAVQEELTPDPTPHASQNEADPASPNPQPPAAGVQIIQNHDSGTQAPSATHEQVVDREIASGNAISKSSDDSHSKEVEEDKQSAPDVSIDLGFFDWTDLEQRFEAEMMQVAEEEKKLEVEFGVWLEVGYT